MNNVDDDDNNNNNKNNNNNNNNAIDNECIRPPPVKINFKIRRFSRSKYENAVHGDAYLAHKLLSNTLTTFVRWLKHVEGATDQLSHKYSRHDLTIFEQLLGIDGDRSHECGAHGEHTVGKN
jgi:hypothetical protein